MLIGHLNQKISSECLLSRFKLSLIFPKCPWKQYRQPKMVVKFTILVPYSFLRGWSILEGGHFERIQYSPYPIDKVFDSLVTTISYSLCIVELCFTPKIRKKSNRISAIFCIQFNPILLTFINCPTFLSPVFVKLFSFSF